MLDEYKRKRNFKKTPEPDAGPRHAKKPKQLSFVIQKHIASHLHYDFRLEAGGVLKSWAVPKGPSLDPKDRRLAMMVEDHPLGYASFEGTIPKGNYGAGEVIVWDNGTYEMMEGTSFEKSLAKGDIKFILHGKKLQGEFALVRMKSEKNNTWLLIKHNDEYATGEDVIANTRSVISRRTLEDPAGTKRPARSGKTWPGSKHAAKSSKSAPAKVDVSGAPKGNMPHEVKPMLAKLAPKPFNREGWLFEIKWDGYRAIAEVEKQPGTVRLYSRRQLPFEDKYPSVVEALKSIRHDVVLDGEIVALNEKGVGEFQLLQDWERSKRGALVYCVFDILYLDGRDLRKLPLIKRKEILRSVVDGITGIQFSDHIENSGIDFFAAAKKQHLEGIMAKDAMSLYHEARRAEDWQKIIVNQQEAVIGGFTAPRGGRKHLGSLVLGVYDGSELVYIGHTGGGFDGRSISALKKQLDPIVQTKSPFSKPPKPNAPVTWVKPELVCEVKFQEWTKDGHMRQPIFLGMREDKKAREVVRERPEADPVNSQQKSLRSKTSKSKTPKGKTSGPDPLAMEAPIGKGILINDTVLDITHPEKVFWPKEKYTKGDVIAYYRAIAPYILPYLKDRPESLHRYPNGINGESFFQKDMDHQPPEWAHTVPIRSDTEDRTLNYLVCDDERTLIYMANLGCIEINPWNSRVAAQDKPDYMILDLDPEGISFDEVVRAALEIKKLLDTAGIISYPKTPGATGLHILVPTHARYDYGQVKQFAEIIMRTVQRRLPKTTSVERNPRKREKKVYLDFLQNRRGQTIAAPYCIRPRDGAPVSTPLEWREVKKGLDPAAFNIKTIFPRLKRKGDILVSLLKESVDLKIALGKLKL